MKEMLTALAAYNAWANQRLLAVMCGMSASRIHQNVESSFHSLYETFLHLWFAEAMWYFRLSGQGKPAGPDPFSKNQTRLQQAILEQDHLLKDWIVETDSVHFGELLQYRNLQGNPFSQPVHEILLHVFNHGTYHRGQAVTLLRQLGVKEIPATDFIVWTRLPGARI